MKVLIVGAGAVGQAYGYHLQKGGAEVWLFVKPKHAQESERGFSLYPLNRAKPRRAPVPFKANGVVTSIEEVAASQWDQIYFCMSSIGLRGDWLEPFCKAAGDSTIVMLQPALEDREFVLRFVPEARLVTGMISIISYHAPLPGESVPVPGIAYWIPPLSANLFSGPKARLHSVVHAFRSGGMPARGVADVSSASAFPGAALIVLVCALEASDWSFGRLVHGPLLDQACRAVAQVSEAVARRLSQRMPFALRLVRPSLVRALLWLAPKFVPLNLEAYLRAHFSKVGDQTRLMMREYVEVGQGLGLRVDAVEGLRRLI